MSEKGLTPTIFSEVAGTYTAIGPLNDALTASYDRHLREIPAGFGVARLIDVGFELGYIVRQSDGSLVASANRTLSPAITDKLTSSTKQLIKDIRSRTREQRDLWRQIPLAALEADGRTGYSDNFSRAYHDGLWALSGSSGVGGFRGYTAYVDLATGDLVNPLDPAKPAHDDAVLAMALHLDELDAARLLADLKHQAKAKIASGYPVSHEADLAANIAKLRTKLSLDERFG